MKYNYMHNFHRYECTYIFVFLRKRIAMPGDAYKMFGTINFAISFHLRQYCIVLVDIYIHIYIYIHKTI